MSLRRAVFLDRDGVINRDSGYVHRIADFIWIDGVVDALRVLAHAGYLLVVVTNQSGIGRGMYSEQTFLELTADMRRFLALRGVDIAHVAYCPHRPAELAEDEPCLCRKPLPGMLLKSAALLDIDLSRSIMIGDKASDMAAGRAAGVLRCILIGDDALVDADARFPDLLTAATHLVRDPALA